MAQIRNLKDNGGNVFYPLTHERAVKDSNGVSLESKLAGLESKSYIEAWDGASTPVVANIPAGVTVTYNSTTYTGTLAASSSTIGKIYLVKNGNDYDRYITSQSGSSYSWSQVGSTEMDLSGYATDAELSQLEAELRENKTVSPTLQKSGYYVTTNGTRDYYSPFGIFTPIPVKAGDKIVATIDGYNSAASPISWGATDNTNSDMSVTPLAEYTSTNHYEVTIENDGYLIVCGDKTTTPIVTIYGEMYDFEQIEVNKEKIAELVDDVNELSEKVAGIDGALDDNEQIPVVIDKGSYYVNPNGTRDNYSQFAIFTPVSVQKGDKIIIGNIYVNAAVCPLAFNTDGNTNSDMTSTPMAVFENGKTVYSAVAPQDGYFIVSNDKTKTPTVEIAKLLDIPEIKQIGSLLSGKITMLFGDSLTAGSTPGVVAFGRVIANVLGVPYRAFVYDRFDPSPDTNAADVDIDIPSITNYGKDGTKNQLTTGRVDSVLQRIKNHITADTNVDYVLVECCVNDYTSGTKGTISDYFTGPFDENTAIGAIEETCRYLSTLGKPIRFGFYIPWQISYVPDAYFNDYIAVFEKWCVPLFDMRKSAGFNMRWCTRHQELYSLPASSYANYDNTATYNLDDKVKYEGFLYKCNADGVTGIPPTNETYWTKVSEGSFDGCHLNSLGHYIVAGKIQSFMERL